MARRSPNPAQAFEELTGAPSLELDAPDPGVFDTLRKAHANGWPSVVWDSHAYYVIDVGPDSVTVRNPWGWEHGEKVISQEELRKDFDGVAISMLP